MANALKECPYCLGSIPAAAQKCQHCGEWISAPLTPASSGVSLGRFFAGQRLDETLNEGVKIWGALQLIGIGLGAVVALVILTQMCSAMNDDPFPHGGTRTTFFIQEGE